MLILFTEKKFSIFYHSVGHIIILVKYVSIINYNEKMLYIIYIQHLLQNYSIILYFSKYTYCFARKHSA